MNDHRNVKRLKAFGNPTDISHLSGHGASAISSLGAVASTIALSIALSIALAIGCGSTPAEQSDAQPSAPPSQKLTGAALTEVVNEGVGWMGQFDYDKAAAAFEKALAAEPDSNNARINLAVALLNRRKDGDLERSAELLDAAMADDRDDL
ncbi:MAG: tetratricopeptide repeat protein, partial [Planctomycetales bacterium]|nr:tetratricopeptide repeat protein [Planctomycetales bacterium]